MNTYLIFDQISPRLRNVLTVILIFIGYLFQITSRNILAGMPFILFCVILNLIKNFSLKRIQPLKMEWKEVTPERVEQVYQHCQRLKKIQGGNWGCVIFFIAIFFIIFFGFPLLEFLGRAVIKNSDSSFAIIAFIIDSLIIFAGLLFSGRRLVWIPNNLDVKIPIIKRVLNHPIFIKEPTIKIIPYLEIGETKQGSFPNDTRILIRFKDAPDDFIGLQFQISINDVQGRKYPYCYSVIIAKKSFNLFQKFKPVRLQRITIERETSEDVDVIIIRQTTTKNSGYHTNESTQDYILTNSINIVKSLIAA